MMILINFIFITSFIALVNGKMWSIYPRRPIMVIPPSPGYSPYYNHYHGQPFDSSHDHRGLYNRHRHIIPKALKDPEANNLKTSSLIDDPMFNEGMYQGDIIGPLPDEIAPFIMENFIWKNGIIPFEIAPELESRRSEIQAAMIEIQTKTCIKFIPRNVNLHKDYVHIFIGTGCSSSVGRRGGKQTLSLGNGCYSNGIIVHELMHAIGFYHLHQRADRDDYLNIHWFNIQPTALNNFKKMDANDLRVDAVFDYDSVMLYGDTTFSKDKVAKTMTPTIHGIELLPPAAKGGLSQVDVMSINRLYSCPNKLLPFDGSTNYIYRRRR